MSGRGKAGKSGKVAAKRHKKTQVPPERISKPALRRLARKGGVKRLSSEVYPAVGIVLKEYLKKIVGGAVIFATYAKRKTVTVEDVMLSLKNHGVKVAGYN